MILDENKDIKNIPLDQNLDLNINIDPNLNKDQAQPIVQEQEKDPFKILNIPNYILPYKAEKRKQLFEARALYLTLSYFSENQINNLKRFINYRNQFEYYYMNLRENTDEFVVNLKDEIIDPFLFNTQLNSLSLLTYYPYKLMLNKLANILMKNGKKNIAFKILFEFFELLKKNLIISNPIPIFIHLLFRNIVPILRGKTIGFRNKKVIGVRLSISKRISITIKTFIKGLKNHKMPAAYALLTEYLNLFKGSSYLQTYNKKMLEEIEEHKLFKALKSKHINFRDTKVFNKIMLPENESNLITETSAFNLDNILNIDWENFDKIIYDLKIINLYESLSLQRVILKKLKEYVILKYSLHSKTKTKVLSINHNLIAKYNLIRKHKRYEYDFMAPDYLIKNKFQKNIKFIFVKGQPVAEKLLTPQEILNNQNRRAKLLFDKLTWVKLRKIAYESQEVTFQYFYNSAKTYIVADDNNKFNAFKRNPDYPKIYINTRKIIDYVYKNFNNFHYFPCFIAELERRLDKTIFNNLSEEDLLLLFMGYNPKLINLSLDKKYFRDIPKIMRSFKRANVWSLDSKTKKTMKQFNDELDLLSYNKKIQPVNPESNAYNKPITESLYVNNIKDKRKEYLRHQEKKELEKKKKKKN